jgi:class 3 adenylate cyclase/pimeloyl-ACP methyl ester carboxylesterase
MRMPEPKYLKTRDGAYIAYQVVGDGPVDIAWQVGDGTHLELWWEFDWIRDWFEGLASLGRLILHDWRGFGLSSRNVPVPNLETRTDDLRAVLDEVGSSTAVIGGWFETVAPGVLLAAADPARVRALVWWNPTPRTVWAPDYPWGDGPELVQKALDAVEIWGTRAYGEWWADDIERVSHRRPSDAGIEWWAKKARNACTPDVAEEMMRMWWQTDMRSVLSSVQAPALLMISEGEDWPDAEHAASLMPDARLQRFPGGWMTADTPMEVVNGPRLDAVAQLVGLPSRQIASDTILSTILFTDVVNSTSHQARLGDLGWKRLIEGHNAVIRESLVRWRGHENDTAGDGFYATFDGPARAIHCAREIRERVIDLGIEVRAGVHTGECELVDGKCAGIAVSTGARIAAHAGASEVLVSQTVKDLVAGSGFTFSERGNPQLKGVPTTYQLYAVG